MKIYNPVNNEWSGGSVQGQPLTLCHGSEADVQGRIVQVLKTQLKLRQKWWIGLSERKKIECGTECKFNVP